MTREELLRIAQEVAILVAHDRHQDAATRLERFAELVAAAAREACAKLCDNYDIRAKTSDGWIILTEAQRVSSELATKIRASGNV
jgi:hypothetical protein